MSESSPAAYIVRALGARTFLEGAEHCREYLRNEQMWFGASTVPAGCTGAVDIGHGGAWEVFFCAAGHAVVQTGELAHEIIAGDALCIPPSVPHQITNVGTEPVLIVWAGAPGPGA